MGNTVVQVQTERDRAILQRVRANVEKQNVSPDKVQPGYLRVAVLADGSKSSYDIVTKKDVGISYIHDRKLDQNDSFVITDLGFYLLCEDPTKPGTGLLQTYPNNQVFAAEANNVTPAHLNVFYNGSYKIKVKETVYEEAFPLNKMLCVRTTQQASASTFSERFGKDGTAELTPDITLNGSEKNEITLNVPTFQGIQIQYVTAATRIYAVFYAYGFLISGGSRLGVL